MQLRRPRHARDRMIVTAARGIPIDVSGMELPTGQCLSGVSARTGQPLIETNAATVMTTSTGSA